MQTWNLPIDATDTLSDSRSDLNDAFATLRSNWIGTDDPGSLVDGMIWPQTTLGKLRGRVAGATVTLGDWAAEMGHLRTDGTVAMTGPLDMGSQKITNLAAPTANADAARKTDVDLKLSRSGVDADRTMAGQILQPDLPTDDTHLTNKAYVDTKIAKAGDTVLGRLTHGSAPTASSSVLDILTRDEVSKLVSFSTTSGHRHTGLDARKVRGDSLSAYLVDDTTPQPVSTIVRADGAGAMEFVLLTAGVLRRFAMGRVNSNGTINKAGTGNWTVVWTNPYYTVTFAGGTFSADPHAIVTIVDGTAGTMFSPTITTPDANTLRVFFWGTTRTFDFFAFGV